MDFINNTLASIKLIKIQGNVFDTKYNDWDIKLTVNNKLVICNKKAYKNLLKTLLTNIVINISIKYATKKKIMAILTHFSNK